MEELFPPRLEPNTQEPPPHYHTYKTGFYAFGTLFLFLLGIVASQFVVPRPQSAQTMLSPTPSDVPQTITPTLLVTTAPTDALPSPTPTPTLVTVRSTVCPISLTYPQDRVFLTDKQVYARWTVKERTNERFLFLPRAEETNVRRVDVELRAEGQIYGNGEANVTVTCQDNHNGWKLDDFISNVKKADYPPQMGTFTFGTFWNRDVYTHSYAINGYTYSVWFASTPTTLYAINQTVYTETFRDGASRIFQALTF